jgi:microcystin-dependent protein
MAVNFSPWGNQQFVDDAGDPATGWKVYSYAAGTSTPLATYTDSGGGTAQSNPIIINSLGFPTVGQIWLTESIGYKLVLTDENDVVQKTEDNITGVAIVSAASFTEWISYSASPTYISATSFSVAGDQRSIFNVGRRIKTANTAGTIYSTIAAVAYTSLTTVTVVNDSGTLDSGLSSVTYGIISSENGSLPIRRDVIPAFADVTDPTKRLRIDVSNLPTATVTVQTTGAGGILPAGIGPLPYAGSSIPSGWLECDGSAVSRTTYAALYTAIADTWGDGDGSTTFNLPDMRGKSPIGDGTGTSTESVTDAEITTGTDTITVTSNAAKWITGMQCTWNVSGTAPTTNPANLLDDADTVYIVRTGATSIKLATSLANAQNGTVIDITATGSGTFTLTHTYTARTLGQYGGEEGHAMSSTEQLSHTHTQNSHTHVQRINSNNAGFGSATNAGGADATAENTNVGATGGTTAVNQSTGGNAAANIMQPFAVVKYIITY